MLNFKVFVGISTNFKNINLFEIDFVDWHSLHAIRDNIDNSEGQPNSTHVDKDYSMCTARGDICYPKFQI